MNSQTESVTTRLVHPIERGPSPWWRTAVIADFTGPLDREGLTRVGELMVWFARMGFNAVTVRPSHVNINADNTELGEVITRAHRAGLKAIVRLSGASLSRRSAFIDLETGVATVVVRSRAALTAGADGIDLGLIDEGPAGLGEDTSPSLPLAFTESEAQRLRRQERFTHLTQILQAELMDFDPAPILCAEAMSRDQQAFHRHLEDEWFHHLRDDALVDAPWDAHALERGVAHALQARDSLGQVAAWQWARTRFAEPQDNVASRSWADHHPERTNAMALYALSLPGACNVPFANPTLPQHADGAGTIASAFPVADADPQRGLMLRRGVRIRDERSVGTGSLAFVDGLAWAHPGVEVHLSAGMLVVLNTSSRGVDVPADHRLLVASFDATDQPRMVPTTVPAGECAWFDTAPHTPAALPPRT